MKVFILDTNVLLHDPCCINSFGKNRIVIPLVVLEELDSFKTAPGERGHHAREIIRQLDALRDKGSLSKGVPLENGGYLEVIAKAEDLKKLDIKVDNIILHLATEMNRVREGGVTIISKDINLRVKADALDIKAEDYTTGKVKEAAKFRGWTRVALTSDQNCTLKNGSSAVIHDTEDLRLNEFLTFKSATGKNLAALGMYSGEGKVQIIDSKPKAVTIVPRNTEQTFALNGLLNDDLKLMTLQAKAGCGKTLLCVAAGIHKVLVEKKYERLVITRPVMPVGNDIGHLPGDIDEKMAPWMKPIFDNIDVIKTGMRSNKLKGTIDSAEFLEVAPLSYLRGRSLANSFIIIDECQNLTQSEVKTIITRVGEGSKIVMTGDIAQIDCIYLDKYSNGLSYVIDKFMGKNLYAHIELVKSERSALAEMAADIL
jgi:PhoH-like ATPase